MDGLTETSRSYKEQAGIYDLFSQAEDKPGKVLDVLIPEVIGKDTLDAGCGTGKYLLPFSKKSKSLIGIDQSLFQLGIAAQRCRGTRNTLLIQAGLERLPLQAGCVDVVVASWVLGTILDEKRRTAALAELNRVLRPAGNLVLVENGTGGEFEALRGRIGDPLERTNKYNEWLERSGFKKLASFETWFQFQDTETAQKVFQEIWGNSLRGTPVCDKIAHNVVIYVRNKRS